VARHSDRGKPRLYCRNLAKIIPAASKIHQGAEFLHAGGERLSPIRGRISRTMVPLRSMSTGTRFTKGPRLMPSRSNSSRWSEARSCPRCSGTIPILLTVHIRERLRTRSRDDESHKEDLHAPPWQGAATGRSTGRKVGDQNPSGAHGRHTGSSAPFGFEISGALATRAESRCAKTAGLVLRGSGVSITGRRFRQKHEWDRAAVQSHDLPARPPQGDKLVGCSPISHSPDAYETRLTCIRRVPSLAKLWRRNSCLFR
jgi:hypothetical protein